MEVWKIIGDTGQHEIRRTGIYGSYCTGNLKGNNCNGGKTTTRSEKCIKLIAILVILVGIFVSGCIEETEKGQINKKEIKKELKIIADDDYSKKVILTAIEKVRSDEIINITEYISSIEVSQNPYEKCDIGALGCTISNSTLNGKLVDSRIYLLKRSLYTGICETFEHTLYHELGHVVYIFKFGSKQKGEDYIYDQTLEFYADKFADRYASFEKDKKEGCVENSEKKLDALLANQEEKKIIMESKGEALQYAINTLSKWDKIADANGGKIPSDMYDQYKYDHDLFSKAQKEFSDASDEYLEASNEVLDFRWNQNG